MRWVMTAEEMRACDQATIASIGVPSPVLMERAALAIADEAEKAPVFSRKKKEDVHILCVCGTGNNGGDGAAAARILFLKGYSVSLLTLGNPDHLTPEMKLQLAACRKLSLRTEKRPAWKKTDIIIDALFGIGLSRAPEGAYAEVIRAINKSGAFVIAADIPSGIDSDSGRHFGEAVKADVTVTMQYEKRGLLLAEGAPFAGHIVRADIGIVPPGKQPVMAVPEEADLLRIPPRNPLGNKGTFGKVLVIAGRKNIGGASVFTGLAAMKTGAGMVRFLTAEENRVILQEKLPEAMLSTYPDEPLKENISLALTKLREALPWADVIACGPGLGTDELSHALVRAVISEAKVPLILDADALNCLQGETSLLKKTSCCILTPHPGEMSRLTGLPVREILADLPGTAASFAGKHHVTVLLKDARTVIASPDGRLFLNLFGNDGMATAGSGDVLTGITAALAARGTGKSGGETDAYGNPCASKAGRTVTAGRGRTSVKKSGRNAGMDMACTAALAAALHGKAGDIAAARCGRSGLMASDIIMGIAEALPEGR